MFLTQQFRTTLWIHFKIFFIFLLFSTLSWCFWHLVLGQALKGTPIYPLDRSIRQGFLSSPRNINWFAFQSWRHVFSFGTGKPVCRKGEATAATAADVSDVAAVAVAAAAAVASWQQQQHLPSEISTPLTSYALLCFALLAPWLKMQMKMQSLFNLEQRQSNSSSSNLKQQQLWILQM